MVNPQKIGLLASNEIDQQQVEEKTRPVLIIPEIRNFFIDADPSDLFLISKFYFTGQEFPNDTASFVFSSFCDQVKRKIKVTTDEAVRKRLRRMVNAGMLLKLGKSPKIYAPLDDSFLIEAIRELIRISYADFKESTDRVFKQI